MRGWKKTVAVAAAVILLTGACSTKKASDEGASGDETTTTQVEEEATTTTAPSEEEQSGGDEGGGGENEGGNGLDDILGDLPGPGDVAVPPGVELLPEGAEECVRFVTTFGAVLAFSAGTAFGADEQELRDLEKQLRELGPYVPEEVREQFEVFSAAYTKYFEALRKEGVLSPRLQEIAAETIESPEVKKAQEDINKWLEENCETPSPANP